MKRTAALCALCLLVSPPISAQEAARPKAPDPRPNLILIVSDDHRWDALGAAGNPAIHTPVLDRMATTGVYFPQATIHVSQCPPTRATLLTGLPPHLHGFHSLQHQEPEAQTPAFCQRPTLPGLLREAGYTTALVGKWHLAADPWDCGFTEIATWIPAGAAAYEDPPTLARGRSRERVKGSGFTQEILARDAIDFLRSRKDQTSPFFLWLAFTAPHLPYAPNPLHIRKLYEGKTVADLLPSSFPKDIPTNPNWVEYYEATSHLDEQIGELLKALEQTDLRDDTVVVFLGDNGYMMGERGIGLQGPAGKVVPYESSLRVPLIVEGVAGLRGTDKSAVSSLDLPPTLLSLAGVPVPETWPGRDLVAALHSDEGLEEAYSEWSDTKSRFGPLAFRSIRTTRYKLIDWEDPEKLDELYDLEADPHESRNRLGDPDLKEVAEDLAGRLRAWRVRTEDPTLEQIP